MYFINKLKAAWFWWRIWWSPVTRRANETDCCDGRGCPICMPW